MEGAAGDLNIALATPDFNGVRGRITLAENRAIVELFATADRSTFMHEKANHFLWQNATTADVGAAQVAEPG